MRGCRGASGRRGSQRWPHASGPDHLAWKAACAAPRGGKGHTSSPFCRCGHDTWGRPGRGWWSPNGLRLLPTLPDPQTHPLLSHSNTFTTAPLSPLPHCTWLSLPPAFSALTLLHSSFMSQGKCHLLREAFPDRPFQPHAFVAPHQLLPCPYQTAITQPPMRVPVRGDRVPPVRCCVPCPAQDSAGRGSCCSSGMTALLFGGNTTPYMCVGGWPWARLLDTRSNQDTRKTALRNGPF